MSEKRADGKTGVTNVNIGAPAAATVAKTAKPKDGAVKASEVRTKRQQAVGAILAPLMQPALAKQGVVLAQIAPHWRAICPLLADHSFPESVKQDILTVAVASDGVKQELHYVTPQIIEGISRLLGYSAITKVRAITRHDVMKRAGARPAAAFGTPPMAPVAAAVRDKADTLCKSVRDDELREALSGLGAQILKEKR
ncbi:MAG: hypothetical protein DI585_03040 [Pseudomonas fluorescens]|nr:MAG: hypothetical protein DI585_03040 [Pseudomonas fluorescens]